MADEPIDGACPVTVTSASMIHRWGNLTFLHWRFPPDDVAPLIPEGFRLDTFDGAAWVGLVPFEMTVKAGRGPGIPWLSYFPETNIRTYVIAPDGSRGVHFLSLDASRLLAVLGGRSAYAMPYYWSAMRVATSGQRISYSCLRRWPGRRAVSSHVAVEVGEPIAAGDVTELEHFLTARWRLYPRLGGHNYVALAEHEPWPLRKADLLGCQDQLLEAAGLPLVSSAPLCHYSDGVDVRIGFPRRMADGR